MSCDSGPPLILKAVAIIAGIFVFLMFAGMVYDILDKTFYKKRWDLEEAREFAKKNGVRELCSIYSFEKFDGKYECSFYTY